MTIKQISHNKKIFIKLLWILSNIVLIVILLFLFMLGGILIRDRIDSDWIAYLIGLPGFGISQGLLMSIFQSPILWFCKLPSNKIFRLSLANIVGATIGIVLPGLFLGSFIMNGNAIILIIICNLSLFAAGFFWGLIAGYDREQKIDWALAMGIAYPLWNISHIMAGVSYFSVLRQQEPIILFYILSISTLLCIVGFCLTIPIVNHLQNKYQ